MLFSFPLFFALVGAMLVYVFFQKQYKKNPANFLKVVYIICKILLYPIGLGLFIIAAIGVFEFISLVWNGNIIAAGTKALFTVGAAALIIWSAHSVQALKNYHEKLTGH